MGTVAQCGTFNIKAHGLVGIICHIVDGNVKILILIIKNNKYINLPTLGVS